uniref:Peptidase M14 carboxypeptidase A domain-containing protein n=1 Tax=Plectus sambesii TaxID=2011161 RepID=A0A914W045_9BILA
MHPENPEQMSMLSQLHDSADEYDLDFWTAPKRPGEFVDLMVPPNFTGTIRDLMSKYNITFELAIADVEKLTNELEGEETPVPMTASKPSNVTDSFFRRLRNDSPSMSAQYNFNDYGSYTKITQWLTTIQSRHRAFTKVFQIGRTHEGRAIKGIKIGSPVRNTKKRAVWIDGGIHAREWPSVHTAIFFINELVSRYGSDREITRFVNMLNIYIVPCLNPDGYELSRSSIKPDIRLWRKNRSKKVCTGKFDRLGKKRCCQGVDLNRNFDFHWGEAGTSSNPCAYNYRGTKAFSEPETRAVRDMILSSEMRGKTDAFISLHTYSQMWMYPFGHKMKTYPRDVNDLRSVGRQAVLALQSQFGTRFELGTTADILYPASGQSADWARQAAGIKYCYTLELRPSQAALNGFILNRNELIPTAKETWAGVKVVINAALKLRLQNKSGTKTKKSAKTKRTGRRLANRRRKLAQRRFDIGA